MKSPMISKCNEIPETPSLNGAPELCRQYQKHDMIRYEEYEALGKKLKP
jgi:hypothetical protein